MLVGTRAPCHQIAYVTRDLAEAQAVFAESWGVPAFFEMPPVTLAEGVSIKGALANVGGIEIELIEPGAGARIYADFLEGQDRPLVLHHVAILVAGDLESWDAHRAGIDQGMHPVALEGAFGDDVRFAYTDECARLGHYIEHLWLNADHLDQMAVLVPHYPSPALA